MARWGRSPQEPQEALLLARVWSCALAGLEGRRVRVEVDIHDGLPHVTIVGLPGAAVREAKDRLYAALRNAGYFFPMNRVTVNLAPGDLPKAGPTYDLPIALGLLAASRQLKADLGDCLVYGEVSLEGRLRPSPGVLPVASLARRAGFGTLVVPAANGPEAALVPGLTVVAGDDLASVRSHLAGIRPLPRPIAPARGPPAGGYAVDLREVRGQAQARRAVEVAAAGGHNLLLEGPPGGGKTLLARCLPSILPPLGSEEALEVTAVYSVAGLLRPEQPLVEIRPFRSPHHTVSSAGLVGGGARPRPGEVSLAHHGVLFLDELPEFDRRSLESLRGPLEDRRVTVSRASGSATFPADFSLVAARNPCPCGHRGDSERPCQCPHGAVERYVRRVSGPLLDRFDMHVWLPRVGVGELQGEPLAEASVAVRARVTAARRRQAARGAPNAVLDPAGLRSHCRLDAAGLRIMARAARQLGLSARSYHRTLKVARTIADLEPSQGIRPEHLAEALSYSRPRSTLR